MGFTMTELLITVAVFTTIAGAAWQISANEMRREEVNSIAVELGGWLKSIQASAQTRPGSTATSLGDGCAITFSGADGSSASPGAVLATVVPAACLAQNSFAIPGGTGSNRTFRVAISGGSGDDSNQVFFTPRGTVTATENVVVRIRLAGSPLTRCVRVGATLGQIQIGSNNNDDQEATTSCSEASYGSVF